MLTVVAKAVASMFGACLMAVALVPEPMSGCTACWYVYYVGGTQRTVRVGCNADLACSSPNFCSMSFTFAGGIVEGVCSCPNMTMPKCRARMMWPGSSESDVPTHDSYPIDPVDWECGKGACAKDCDEETTVDESLPAGEDTPCICPP